MLLHYCVILSGMSAANGVEESLRLPLEGSEAHGAVVNDNPVGCQSHARPSPQARQLSAKLTEGVPSHERGN